ncbi:membrane protein [Cellulomonas hominis]|uniref:Membrane protein n=1 Tax=Cellulomonas hominis TaxID=156981 RepID=A0A511FH81_9CELL|nr:alpha/beta-hydrolase family protein [Cellulomonas hominis]MBB5471549.1 putative membrane protein [Cellulomonas hominis]GEL48606.1 membrane protein [Cellulomonas hominis]
MDTDQPAAAPPQPATPAANRPAAASGFAPALRRAGGPVARWFARRRLSWSGMLGALLGLAAAMTPSLLPRPTLYLGLIAGVGTAAGYGLGVLVAWIVRRTGLPLPPVRVRRAAWRVLAWVGPVLAVVVVVVGAGWQNDVRELVGEQRRPSSWFLVGVIAFLVGLGLIALGRALRRLSRRIARLLGRWVPAPAASLLGVVLVALLVYWLAAGVLFRVVVDVADSVYAGTNAGTDEGVEPVTSDLRSGSPASAVSWDSLGRQGRTFVAGGPTTAEIGDVTGQAAVEPIRVYAGLDSAGDAAGRADLVVQELERTGAFDRSVLVVAGATGTGWTEPQQMAALEYLWGGDTAIATMQYSFLPSWISFLVDADRATEAGRVLFDAVHEAWSALPEDDRPQLVSYGLSLGSFAAQAPFGSVGDLTTRVDGALYVGTPNFTPLWRTITDDRDAGSPEWQPVVDDGETVRFASDGTDLGDLPGDWGAPRVAYLQHASDPVVWWSWDLLARQPDWLAEPRGPDVSGRVRWFPLITFVQVTVDQFFGVSVPDGHGHNYASQVVAAWADVTEPPGWTDADLADLQSLIDETLELPSLPGADVG